VGECVIRNLDYRKMLRTVKLASADLILTDIPYVISKSNKSWRPGTKSLERYAKINRDFGKWDYEDIDLDILCKYAYKVLRDGGTFIVWYDLWKMNNLANIMRKHKFKQLRMIEWVKTNPLPFASKLNYLVNMREIALLGVKKAKPTFNSEYDSGIYYYPTVGNKGYNKVVHPTQKPLGLFNEIVLKHSRENDLVVDPFLGSGTTAMACVLNGRRFKGGDLDMKYCKIAKQRVKLQHAQQHSIL